MLFYAFGTATAGYAVLGGLLAAALLESALAICLGCRAFALLMALGLVPPEVCARCADITLQL